MPVNSPFRTGVYTLAAAPCFCQYFDLVARGMNIASIIYAIYFPLQDLTFLTKRKKSHVKWQKEKALGNKVI